MQITIKGCVRINTGFVWSDQTVQFCTGTYLPSDSCHSAQQLVASSLSFCLRMYICTLSESQAKFLRHHKLPQFTIAHNASCTINTSESSQHQEREANLSGKLYSIHLTSCETWRYTVLDLHSGGIWMEWHPWLYDWHQEPKADIYTISQCLCFYCTNNRI